MDSSSEVLLEAAKAKEERLRRKKEEKLRAKREAKLKAKKEARLREMRAERARQRRELEQMRQEEEMERQRLAEVERMRREEEEEARRRALEEAERARREAIEAKERARREAIDWEERAVREAQERARVEEEAETGTEPVAQAGPKSFRSAKRERLRQQRQFRGAVIERRDRRRRQQHWREAHAFGTREEREAAQDLAKAEEAARQARSSPPRRRKSVLERVGTAFRRKPKAGSGQGDDPWRDERKGSDEEGGGEEAPPSAEADCGAPADESQPGVGRAPPVDASEAGTSRSGSARHRTSPPALIRRPAPAPRPHTSAPTRAAPKVSDLVGEMEAWLAESDDSLVLTEEEREALILAHTHAQACITEAGEEGRRASRHSGTSGGASEGEGSSSDAEPDETRQERFQRLRGQVIEAWEASDDPVERMRDGASAARPTRAVRLPPCLIAVLLVRAMVGFRGGGATRGGGGGGVRHRLRRARL